MRRARSWVALGICGALFLALLTGPAEARRRRGHRHHHRAARPQPAIPALTALGLPNVRSGSALAIDMDNGTILFGKNPDAVRAIASTGKIFVALVARRRGMDLDGVTQITMEDATYARGGSRTHLDVGQSFRNRDLLRAMLVASDNRAVTAVARGAGLTPDQLVTEMNGLAVDLGLKRTTFTDPTGLNGNWSTAREMAMALAAALRDPVLAEILSTRFVSIQTVTNGRPRTLHYTNTNRVLHRERLRVLGGKTGYTRDAGYCLVTGVEMDGRRLAFVFLGGDGELTRFADFNRVMGWMVGNRGGDAASVSVEATAIPAVMPAANTGDAR
ncbi:MAG TPA: serine hydrolase [Kofleriaceae bacterium]|nr:serine hydrolase [Kofleriaceae bacterium]